MTPEHEQLKQAVERAVEVAFKKHAINIGDHWCHEKGINENAAEDFTMTVLVESGVLSRIADLERDRERLDWLQHHTHWIMAAESGDGYSIGHNGNFQNWAVKVQSVRSAIDAAMTTPNTKGEAE